MNEHTTATPHKPVSRCPMCKAETQHRWRPFCSRRCADLDLARWLSGRYAIPGGDADSDEDGDEGRIPRFGQNDGPQRER